MKLTFKRVYEYGGDCKADDTDYICGYQASNGVMIEKKFADGLNIYCWKIGEDYYNTLNAAKNAVIRKATAASAAAQEAANETETAATEAADEPATPMVQDETGTFCHAGFTLNELIQWARENHVEFDLPVYIDTGKGFRAVNHVGASMDWVLGSSFVIQRVEAAQTQEQEPATPVNQAESDSAEAGQPALQADMTDEEKIDALFHELVPMEGKADTVAGEIVRAVCRIGYRYNNDGDYVGSGYGKETCNPAARYLMANAGENVAEIVRCLWKAGEECGVLDDGSYGDWLSELVEATLAYLGKRQELKTTPNAEDMWDYRDPDEDVDEWDDDDEDEWDAA